MSERYTPVLASCNLGKQWKHNSVVLSYLINLSNSITNSRSYLSVIPELPKPHQICYFCQMVTPVVLSINAISFNRHVMFHSIHDSIQVSILDSWLSFPLTFLKMVKWSKFSEIIFLCFINSNIHFVKYF